MRASPALACPSPAPRLPRPVAALTRAWATVVIVVVVVARRSHHHLEAQRRQQAQMHLARLYARDQMREMPFHPRVTRSSEEIDRRARRSGSAPPSRRRTEAPRVPSRDGTIHDSLFEDAKYKRRELLKTEAELEGQIADVANSHSVKVLRKESLRRLCTSHLTKEDEIGALREYLHRPQDPETGQMLYTPRILRGPKEAKPWQRDGAVGRQAKHTGNALHDSRHQIRAKRTALEQEALRQQEEAARMPTQGRFTEGKSDKLVRKARRQRLRQIFAELDVEGEGVLDGKQLAARLEELPADVMAALQPAVETFKGDALAFTDFESLVEQALSKSAPAGPRAFLLPDRGDGSIHALHFAEQMRQQAAECSFAPRLDAKSAAMAERRRQKGVAVHDALRQSREAYEAKCEAARKAKEQQEVDACTFKPAGQTAKARHAASRLLEPPSNKKEGKLTSEEKEVYEHCTFRPATNTNFSGSTHRIDCSPPLAGSLSDLGRHLAGSELRRSASYTQRARACSEAGSEAGGSMAGSVASGVSYNAQNGSFRRGYAAANGGGGEQPAAPAMSAAEADAAAELQAAEGAAEAAALMAQLGGEVEAMAEPLSAQQLEAKFYADLAAELRDADF